MNYKLRKKILLLGGEGFIGRNIADCLGDFYWCDSIGINQSIFKKRKDRFLKINPYQKTIKNDYDVIIHLIDNQVDIADFVIKENELIKSIGLNSHNHLIIFSSAVVYADPHSEYAQRKLELEKIYQAYCRKKKICLTILRLFNIYGPYQFPRKRGSLVANIFCNYLSGREIIINDWNAKRDFIYSVDMARMVKWVVENKFTGVDDLATNKLLSLRSLISIIKKDKDIVKKKIFIVDKKIKEKDVSPQAKSGIISNIELSDLRTGLHQTLRFYKDNLSKIKKEYGI